MIAQKPCGGPPQGLQRENPSSGVRGAGFRVSWWVRRKREQKRNKKWKRRSKEDWWRWQWQRGHHRDLVPVHMDFFSASLGLLERGNWVE